MTSSGAAPSSPASTGAGGGSGVLPSSGAYLGAWLNPGGGPGQVSTEIASLSRLGRARPAVLGAYTSWGAPAPVASLRTIAAQGAVPMLAWGCTSTAAVAGGSDDAEITAYATALRSYGGPVLLRWFWEMNLPSAAHEACLGDGGVAGFLAAWDHLRAIFRSVGAANVAFVWCPGVSTAYEKWFPGADEVDAVGADGYATTAGEDVAAVFGVWYARFAPLGRPLVVAETGARPGAQAAYLTSARTELPRQLPAVRVFAYFDAPGPRGDWSLEPAGLAALGDLAATPYFAARPGG